MLAEVFRQKDVSTKGPSGGACIIFVFKQVDSQGAVDNDGLIFRMLEEHDPPAEPPKRLLPRLRKDCVRPHVDHVHGSPGFGWDEFLPFPWIKHHRSDGDQAAAGRRPHKETCEGIAEETQPSRPA